MNRSPLKSAIKSLTARGQRVRGTAFLAAVTAATLLSPDTAEARGLIKQPGAHPRYTFELEPHITYRYDTPVGYADDDGFGPGIRAAIPLFHNGPIGKINNSMAIGFGADLTFHSDSCRSYYGTFVVIGSDCDATAFTIPTALQWNFWFTDIISVFGEAGMNAVITSYDYFPCTPSGVCGRADDTDFDLEPNFSGGGRFWFDRVGVVVRLGWPYASAGATFLF